VEEAWQCRHDISLAVVVVSTRQWRRGRVSDTGSRMRCRWECLRSGLPARSRRLPHTHTRFTCSSLVSAEICNFDAGPHSKCTQRYCFVIWKLSSNICLSPKSNFSGRLYCCLLDFGRSQTLRHQVDQLYGSKFHDHFLSRCSYKPISGSSDWFKVRIGRSIADLEKKAVAEWLQSFNSVRGPMEWLGIM